MTLKEGNWWGCIQETYSNLTYLRASVVGTIDAIYTKAYKMALQKNKQERCNN